MCNGNHCTGPIGNHIIRAIGEEEWVQIQDGHDKRWKNKKTGALLPTSSHDMLIYLFFISLFSLHICASLLLVTEVVFVLYQVSVCRQFHH
jgi:hypothetical protein